MKVFLCILLVALTSSLFADFYDDFSDGALTGWSQFGGRQWIENAQTQVVSPQANSNNKGFLIWNEEIFGAGMLSANVVASQWNGHFGGVVFRWTSETQFYYVTILPGDASKKHVYFCENTTDVNQCQNLGNTGIHVGTSYNLQVQVSGQTFRVLIDGVLHAIITDDSNFEGKVGMAYHNQWNDYIDFTSFSWIDGGTQSSSSAISSSSTPVSSSTVNSSSNISSSSTTPSSSSIQTSSSSLNYPTVEVKTFLTGQASNFISITAEIKNTSNYPLGNLALRYFMNWADHSSPLEVNLDWSNIPGVKVGINERPDFIAEIDFNLETYLLQPNEVASLKFRFNLEGYGDFDYNNDPSFQGVLIPYFGLNQKVGVLQNGEKIYGLFPLNPLPLPSNYEVTVRTIKTQESSNTLGYNAIIKNESQIPVTGLSFKYYTDPRDQQGPLVVAIDYKNVRELETTIQDVNDSVREVVFNLKDSYFAAGQEKSIQFRLHSSGYTSQNFLNDFSYTTNGDIDNPKVAKFVEGLHISGAIPYEVSNSTDTDSDGIPDYLEIQNGTDPTDPDDYPFVGVPNIAELAPTGAQTVLYDFSKIPGYENSTEVPMVFNPEDFSDLNVPSIKYQSEPNVPLNKKSFIPLTEYFDISASLSPGKSINITLPTKSTLIKGVSQDNVRVFHLDHNTLNWDEMSGFEENGFIKFETNGFSTFVGGKLIRTNSLGMGETHAVFIDESSQILYAIGKNNFGQLGNGTTQDALSQPEIVAVTGTPLSVVSGLNHNLVLMDNLSIYAWGSNQFGQIGNGVIGGNVNDPVAISFSLFASEVLIGVAAGDHHSMAITSFGRVFSWGRNDKGQLGLGIKGTPDLTHRGSPEVVENYFESTESGYVATSQTVYVEQVDGGSNHSVAAGSGKFWTWGGNEYGQLGEVTETEIIVSNTPRSFPVSIDPQAIGVIKNNWTHPNSESYPLDVSRNTLSAGANTTMLMYGIFYNYPSGISWGSWIDTPEKCSMSRYTNNFDVGFDHCITYRIIDFSLNLHGVNNSSGELGSSDVNLSLNQLALTEAPLDIASGYNNSGALYENKLWLWGGIFGNQIIIPWTSIGFSVITPNATEADFISISGTSDLVNGIVTVSLNGSEVITTVNSDRMWSLDLDLNSVVTGTYMASASLSGIDGKIIKTLSFELKVDHTNMTVSPTTNFLHVKPEKIFINGINSNDVESIIFSINGHDLFATINGTGWSVEPDLSNLADGDYPYEIKSEDIAGNQLTSNGIISVDGTPPHITIVSPAQGTTTLASVILVEWRVDGGPIQTRNEPLITGMNSIILVATDQAGNYNSETVTVEKAELTNLIRSVTINSRKLLQPSGEFIVSYETVFSASVTLKIMDANELVVYSKSLGFVPKGANQVTWNGLNQANQLLATGLYRFELQAEIEGQTVSFNEESTPESISASKVNVIVPYTESHKASAEFTANKDIIAAVNVKIYSPVQKSIQVLAPAIYSQGSNSLRLENYGEGDVIITERKKHNVYLSAIKAATGFLAIVRKPPFNNVKVHRRNLSATDFDFLDIALDIDRIASVNIEIRSQDGSNEKILCDGTSILEVGRHEFGWDGMLYDTVNQKDYLAKSGVYIITIHSSEPDYGDFYDRYVIKLEGGE